MMIGRCGGPPRNSAEFIGSSFLAHTHKIRGRAGPRASNSIPSRPLKGKRSRPSHFITSTPRTHEPTSPRAPRTREPPSPPRNIPLLSRIFLLFSRASNGPGSGAHGQWLPASLMAVSACHRRHRPETSPSPNGPGAAKERERKKNKKKKKQKKTSAPRSRSSSVNRSVCWSAGMQLHWIPHSQHTLPALNSVSAV